MTLTNRQFEILQYCLENKQIFITTETLAQFFKVSVRTVKNDLGIIRQYIRRFKSFQLIAVRGQGIKLQVLDSAQFKNEKNLVDCERQLRLNASLNRVRAIAQFLLDKTALVSKSTLMNYFYISETTLYNSLKKVKKLFADYNLELVYQANRGYIVKGSELNKRDLLAKNGDYYRLEQHLPENTAKIYNIVADSFIKYQYRVDEAALQNITAQIFVSLSRLKNFHFIEQNISPDLKKTPEYKIANDILKQLIDQNLLQKHYYEREVLLLTQIILGQLNCRQNDVLQEEISDFIDQAFAEIYAKFSINFESVDNLKVLLVLHLVPLFYRVRSKTQLANPLAAQIYQSFPQAQDIALYFSTLINQNFHLKISKSELSYLTLYFNYGLENYLSTATGKKILIISMLRKSETVLLRHKILSWFPNQIETIEFIYPNLLNEISFASYDAIFTTETHLEKYQNLIPLIKLFPTEQDFNKINLMINGYADCNSILGKFSELCFFAGSVQSKEEVLQIVVTNAAKKYHLGINFLNSIRERERLSTTYFGNGIAIPHPLAPMTNSTFVSVAILKNPLIWDEKNKVNLVMLVSIAKDSPKDFQLWYYLSAFIQNPKLIKQAISGNSYSQFRSTLKLALKDFFS